MSTENIKEVVKEKYGQAALRVTTGRGNACCGSAPSSASGCADPITSDSVRRGRDGRDPRRCGESLARAAAIRRRWRS